MNNSENIEIPRISVITVTYNSSAVLESFFLSIPDEQRPFLEIIIVDNNSKDNTLDLAKKFDCTIIKLRENLGFGVACNKGAEAAHSDFLFFVNPDCKFENNTFTELNLTLSNYPEASALNPRILNNDKPYFRKRSGLLPKTAHWIGSTPDKDMQIPVLSGCAIFCKKSLFNKIGGFDPNIFLYYEDDDISLRFLEDGPLMIAYSSTIHHNFGHSSGRDSKTAWFKGYHLSKSKAYAMKKHGLKWSYGVEILKLVSMLFMPHVIFNKRRRHKYKGMLQGVIDFQSNKS